MGNDKPLALIPQDLGFSYTASPIHRNLTPKELYSIALDKDDCTMTSREALVAYSGEKTGRSPQDKRVVDHPETRDSIWWKDETHENGSPNQPISRTSFLKNKDIAVNFLESSPTLFVQDGIVNWGIKDRVKIRVIATRAYHALFIQNMMIRPSEEELLDFGEPDFIIYNAGRCPADPAVEGVATTTSVCIDIDKREMVILGTEYAGEMKKGIFSIMHYLMPERGHLTLHSGCNVGAAGDVTVFFGLSGTGKTTLSTDSNRPLIGDDEHCWAADGISNIEGGCYAKCINLRPENEPEICDAIKFGCVLENVVLDASGVPDFDDISITPNTRACYPIEHIPNAVVPCEGAHPRSIILLCADYFGVLPPVARLNSAQLMYHFISGYTAKMPGTEVGVVDPEVTFSPCFGGAFLMLHPMKYAKMLAKKAEQHGSAAWFINTGNSGGGLGVGSRMKLKHTRAIIDAIHSGELDTAEYVTMPTFGLRVPTHVTGVPDDILFPRDTWVDKDAYDKKLQHLADLFIANMKQYEDGVYAKQVQEVRSGGPSYSKDSIRLELQSRKSSCGGALASASSLGKLDSLPRLEPHSRKSSCGVALGSATSLDKIESLPKA